MGRQLTPGDDVAQQTDDSDETFEEHRDRVRRQVPPAVYLPVASADSSDFYEVEMRTTNDGRVALLAYTALDRLATCCGPHQPWVLYPTDRLEELGQSQPHDVVYLDMRIPEELWRTAPDAPPDTAPAAAGEDAP